MIKGIIAGYATFLLLGAFFGWKAGSKVSLIMGLVSSACAFIGYFLVITSPKTGFIFLTALAAILSVVFIVRLLKTKKFMPSGGLFLITLLFLILCAIQILKA